MTTDVAVGAVFANHRISAFADPRASERVGQAGARASVDGDAARPVAEVPVHGGVGGETKTHPPSAPGLHRVSGPTRIGRNPTSEAPVMVDSDEIDRAQDTMWDRRA
jgi:hypothetical protein